MRGFRYFLVVLAAVAGLSVAIRLVYTRQAFLAASEPTPAVPVVAPGTPAIAPALSRPVPAEVADTSVISTPRRGVSRRSSSAPTRRAPAEASPVASVPSPRAGIIAPPPTAPFPAPPAVVEPEALWQATPRQLVRDSAYVMVSSGRLQAAIAVLDGWVRAHPEDTDIAIDLARLRARTGDWTGSIAQYSALLERDRTPQLLFERGQTWLWSGDVRRGEADLLAAEALLPRVESQRQLGDHYRWQGDLARSAAWYRRALQTAPGDSASLHGLRLLDAVLESRLRQPGELGGRDFGSGAHVITDNAGFDLYSLRIGQAFALRGSGAVVTVSGEVRSASRLTTGGLESQLDAYGADLSFSRRAGASKVTASAGVVDHDGAPAIVRGAFSADGFAGSTRMRIGVSRLPAYEALWAPRMLGVAGSPATAVQAQASASRPFGRSGEAFLMGEYLGVSDDNARFATQLALRHRLAGPLSLVYAGSVMAFDRQVPLYYSPARYHAQTLGLELSRYREDGVSYAWRAVPGYAWMREPSGIADSSASDRSAFQFTTGLELGYRRGPWDLLLSTGYSAGREGGYRSQSATLWLRRSWE